MVGTLLSFETAKLAKDKGFNLKTNKCYFITSNYPIWNPIGEIREYPTEYNWNDGEWGKDGGSNPASAPSQSLLQRWLREVHNLHPNIHPHYDNFGELSGWEFTSISRLSGGDNHINRGLYDTYEEALEQGLIEALKLI